MVRQTLLFLVVSLLFVTPVLAETKFPFTAEAVSDRVNIRAGENNNFESVATLNKGERIVVLGKSFSWYKVSLPDGAKAFIKAEYVMEFSPGIGEVTADRVNVRAAPNTNATVLGQVKKGKKFFVKEKMSDGWLWIRPVDETVGWVHAELLTFKSNQVVLPASNAAEVAVVKKVLPAKIEEPKPSMPKVSLIKKIDNGMVECSGKLTFAESAPVAYKVVRDNVTVCLVDGPQSLFQSFVNMNVMVKGKVKEDVKSLEAPVVSVNMIKVAI